MLRAYKYRIYPTVDQKVLLEKHFGSARFLYNRFLDYRQKQYALGNKVSYFDTQKILTTLKKEDDLLLHNIINQYKEEIYTKEGRKGLLKSSKKFITKLELYLKK